MSPHFESLEWATFPAQKVVAFFRQFAFFWEAVSVSWAASRDARIQWPLCILLATELLGSGDHPGYRGGAAAEAVNKEWLFA